MEIIGNKKEKNNRTERINLRLTSDELDKLTKKADSYNLPMAKYLRDRILELPPPIERVHDLPKINSQLMREISSIGKNLNQITRLAHIEHNVSNSIDVKMLFLSLDRISDELQKLREQYSVKNEEVKSE